MSEFSADQYFEGGDFTIAKSVDLEALKRWIEEEEAENGPDDHLCIATPLMRKYLAALERAERVEVAARTMRTYYDHWRRSVRIVGGGRDSAERLEALDVADEALRAALAPAPEGSEECQHEFGALGAVSGDHCIHCGKRLSNEAGWPSAPAPGEEGEG